MYWCLISLNPLKKIMFRSTTNCWVKFLRQPVHQEIHEIKGISQNFKTDFQIIIINGSKNWSVNQCLHSPSHPLENRWFTLQQPWSIGNCWRIGPSSRSTTVKKTKLRWKTTPMEFISVCLKIIFKLGILWNVKALRSQKTAIAVRSPLKVHPTNFHQTQYQEFSVSEIKQTHPTNCCLRECIRWEYLIPHRYPENQ